MLETGSPGKDFDFLNAGDEEMSSEKEENLDENLEDIGKMELEAAMVAGKIEKLMGRDGSAPLQVTDDKTEVNFPKYPLKTAAVSTSLCGLSITLKRLKIMRISTVSKYPVSFCTLTGISILIS